MRSPRRSWRAWDDGCSIIYRAKEPWAAKHFVLETVRGQYNTPVDGHTHPEVLRLARRARRPPRCSTAPRTRRSGSC